MPSIFAKQKRNHLEDVKAEAAALTKERLAADFAKLNMQAAQRSADAAAAREAAAVEAEVVEAPAKDDKASNKPKVGKDK